MIRVTMDALEQIAFTSGAPMLASRQGWTVRTGGRTYMARA